MVSLTFELLCKIQEEVGMVWANAFTLNFRGIAEVLCCVEMSFQELLLIITSLVDVPRVLPKAYLAIKT